MSDLLLLTLTSHLLPSSLLGFLLPAQDLAQQTLTIKTNANCVPGTSGKDPVAPVSDYQRTPCKCKQGSWKGLARAHISLLP